jgi:hypothetical protein
MFTVQSHGQSNQRLRAPNDRRWQMPDVAAAPQNLLEFPLAQGQASSFAGI